ncbi:MAG: IS21 family transposase, partial [Actinomycetota bacterium]
PDRRAKEPCYMLTREEDVEANALRRRGWSISAIARHLGRDRKTVRRYLTNGREAGRRRSAHDWFAAFVPYIEARFEDDKHLWTTVLYRELTELGFLASYQTLTREVRARCLRPPCKECMGTRPDAATIEIQHPPGEEMQFDWLELTETPWGVRAYVLVGALSYSSKCRGAFSDGKTTGHLVESLDQVLRRIGGTTRRWRTDRMSGVVVPGTDRLTAAFADVARFYGVAIDVCSRGRAQRKGVVEAANRYITQGWWRTAEVSTPAQAQQSLDSFCVTIAQARERGDKTVAHLAADERLAPLPQTPYPAVIEATNKVTPSALVPFDGNFYSVPPELIGAEVVVRTRLRAAQIEVVSASGAIVVTHDRAPKGRHQIVRLPLHRAALEQIVLAGFTTDQPCRHKPNRPPGGKAKAAAAALRGDSPRGDAEVIDLSTYERLSKGMR